MIKLKLQQFAAPGSLSALREETFDNLQLNCGIFIRDLVYEGTGAPTDADTLLALIESIISGANTTSGKLLGATNGGGSFNVSREMRNPEVDGLRYRFKGGVFVDSADPYISTTLVETTPENFAIAMGGEITTTGKLTKVRMKTAIEDETYLTNLCWVGELADGRLVIINLYNALNTADFSFTFKDKGEGNYSVEFHAAQENVDDYDYAPFEVVFFGKAA